MSPGNQEAGQAAEVAKDMQDNYKQEKRILEKQQKLARDQLRTDQSGLKKIAALLKKWSDPVTYPPPWVNGGGVHVNGEACAAQSLPAVIKTDSGASISTNGRRGSKNT